MLTEQDIVSLRTTLFLSGPAGTGKTTLAVRRLLTLIKSGVPGDSIVVLAPQRSLLSPYQDALEQADLIPGTRPWMLTLGGLARQMVDLFWPAISRMAGFAHPNDPPVFLTLETAQYYMARVVVPLMSEAGYFEGIHLQRPRLYSQILDNLNKAALVGFLYTEIGDRLKAAWGGEARRAMVFAHSQDAAIRFRQFCLQNNLLDFSLQVEILTRHLLTEDWFRDYVFGLYRHLIADNVEEEPPVTHDLLREWLLQCDSALIVDDQDAGYRSFLGADPDGAESLRHLCRERIDLTQSRVASRDLETLADAMSRIIRRESATPAPALSGRDTTRASVRNVLGFGGGKFHPQMLDWITDEIVRLTQEDGVAPGQIVVLAPFLSDSLRFALTDRLDRRNIPTRSLRPSRALNEEPAARCLLTWAALAHPTWDLVPALPDVAHALSLTVDGLDAARAHLLAQRVYAAPQLRPFEGLHADLQDRIGFDVGQRYDRLRGWLDDYRAGHTSLLDHFLSRLFGEVISQPGFMFHRNFDAGRVAAGLIASARKFRLVLAPDADVGRAYIELVQSGVIAAQHYVPENGDAVLLAPAYTFLLSNQPTDVQFWINAGSPGWWERLYQPLTHPYVLMRQWESGRKWTDEDEQSTKQLVLSRLVQGLIRRCRKKVYLAFSTLNEQGFEERGPLLMVAQQILRQSTTD